VARTRHPAASPVGDEMRSYVPRWGTDSTNFALLNRGKASVALDLKDTAQQARLLARADVVPEQFRPGVMERLGLGYAAVSEINPRVIYCAITGHGQTGPKRDVAGHDLNYIGDTGLLSVSSGDPARPVVPPALLADIAAGSDPAFMNILLAVIARQATGRGCYLDVAMTDNVFPFLYWAIGKALGGGAWAGVDLADLLALAVGLERDVLALDGEQAPVVVQFGLGAAVVAGAHGEAVGHQVGQAEHQHDAAGQGGTDDPRNDRKGRDRAVDPAVDPVAQMVAAGVLGEALLDRFRGVVVLQQYARRGKNVAHDRPPARCFPRQRDLRCETRCTTAVGVGFPGVDSKPGHPGRGPAVGR
jgi:hypothetical protein